MKKIIFLTVLMLVLTVCVFAQNYTVQKVTGNVRQEKSGGTLALKEGDTLSGDTVIISGVGASFVLKEGDKTFTIKNKESKKDKVSELIKTVQTVQKPINQNIANTNTNAVARTTAQTTTGSARASDAAQVLDISSE